MRQASVQILSAASDSSETGLAFNVAQAVSATFQTVGTNADEAGTLKIQGSNDVITNGAAPTNWSDITDATSTIASGAGPMIVIATMSYVYVRAVFTRSGGGASNKLINVQMNYLSL